MNTRDRLLETALELFASRGYDAVGVQEIVAVVGVTKPTLYHHFGNKQGLLDALLVASGDPFASELEAAAAYAGDLPLTLDRVAAAYFGLASSQPAFYRLLLALSSAPPEHEAYAAVSPLLERQRALLESLFERAACDHGNMRGRHRRYALTFVGTMNAYAGLVINGQVRADARARRELVHQFSHGIYSLFVRCLWVVSSLGPVLKPPAEAGGSNFQVKRRSKPAPSPGAGLPSCSFVRRRSPAPSRAGL